MSTGLSVRESFTKDLPCAKYCCYLVSKLWPTLVTPWSLPGSSVPGILQARILEWVAISSSRASSWPRDQTHVSCVSCTADRLFTTEPPGKLSNKESACNAGDAGDVGLIPGSRRSPGGEYGNPLQYFRLGNPTDRGAWRATVHGGGRVEQDWSS